MGNRSYAAQQLTLQAGKTYTLSAYFKGSDGARLAVSYGTTTIESLGVMGASSSWQRESLTFTVPTDAGSSVNVQLKLPGDVSGSVYADCVMLEQADAMNRYNLLENSDFNSNTIWSRGSGLDSNDAIVSVSGSLHPDSLSSAVYKITGSTTADKVVSQTLPISGSTGDCYTFGGWAQMNTVPAFTKNAGTSSEVNYGQRKLRLGFVGASETKYYEVSFNPDNSEWQYICGAAVAPFNYTAIAEYAKHDRAEFVRVVQEAQSSQQTAEVKKQRTRLATAKQRVSELEVLLCKIYEDNILGKLSDSRYATLDAQYEKEQSELTAEISVLEKAVKSYEKHEKDADRFIALIDKYENFDKLTIAMLNEFIEKILVHERDRKGSIQTTQEVEIYFNFVGRFVPPAFGEVELTPEELEEIRKREERKDRLHQNYLKRKANGKQKEYEERTKAKKKAEIEARKQAIRTEDIARGVFIPVSSLPQLGPRKGA